MKINLTREKRRTIALKIENDGEISLKAPLKASDKVINDFIKSKRNWLEKNITKISNMQAFQNQFDFYNKIYILGKPIEVEQIDLSLKGSIAKAQEFSIYYEDYYKKSAAYLIERAKELAEKYNLKYRTIKLTSSKHFWGNFRKNGDMKLNYKAVILPGELVDYIIIHELCHRIHLNHSKQFWLSVYQFFPNYKKLKKELSLYSFLLS